MNGKSSLRIGFALGSIGGGWLGLSAIALAEPPLVPSNELDTFPRVPLAERIAEEEKPANSEESETSYSRTPLQFFPTRLITIDTANVLPAGSLQLSLGVRLFPRGNTGQGTGLQNYSVSIEGGVSDRLQLGFDGTFFDDRLGESFEEGVPFLSIINVAPKFKYQFLRQETLSLAVSGSLEIGTFTGSNGLYTDGAAQRTSTTVGGTLQLPLTYNFSPSLQGHLVPSVVFWPDTINGGGNFYGTFLNFGAGLNYTPFDRLTLFTDVNFPLTSGNAVNTQGDITQEVVWSAGLTYLHSPTVAIDLYATNAFGTTPATRSLAFIPGGGQVAAGFNLKYTPDLGQGYPTGFRSTTAPLSDRDRQLLFNGITITSPETLKTGTLSLMGGTGPGFNFQLSYGLSDDAQLSFVGQQLADNDTSIDDDSFKLGAYGRLRFLSQSQGDPFSLAVAGGFEQGADQTGSGLFTTELAFLYQINPWFGVMFNPKVGFYGSESIWGAGFGLNYDVWQGIQLMGEVTPILSGEVSNTLWAAGIRYFNPHWNVGIDLYGTNAAGTYGIGGLVAQSNHQVSVGFNILWLLGGK